MAKPRVLVTGFMPFGGSNDNPSKVVAERLAADPPSGINLFTGLLPVTWSGSWPTLRGLLDQHRPSLVLLMGQSGKRPRVTVERFALNFGQGRIPDNDGVSRGPSPLVDGAPLALAASIDVDATVEAMQDADAPAGSSHEAGTFLCNAVLFHALLHAAPGQRAGFIHVPMLPSQSGAGDHEPTLNAETSERSVRAAIASAVG
ncbi:MAG: pyroglutamyl-peptidase I [Phycisphaera sp.]|nr:MAG: pyroglutamyl-peptidase I [Phycisphaera sp.]